MVVREAVMDQDQLKKIAMQRELEKMGFGEDARKHGFGEDELKCNRSINTFLMSNIGISSEISPTLALMIKSNEKLHTLDLSSNDLSEKAMHDIANAIRENQGLIELNLSGNPVPSETGCELLRSISIHGKLQTVVMQNCVHGSDCADQVANVIAKSKSITKLDVSECQFASPGIDRIC